MGSNATVQYPTPGGTKEAVISSPFDESRLPFIVSVQGGTHPVKAVHMDEVVQLFEDGAVTAIVGPGEKLTKDDITIDHT
jgi:hypothetical protein